MTRLVHVLRLAGLCAMLLILACSFEASFSASVSFRISVNARVVSQDATQQAEVAPDQVAMPEATVANLDLKPGVILVSEDFVRKVVSVETLDGKVVAKTERASLEQVIEKGEYATVYDLGSDSAVIDQWASASPKAVWSGKGFDVVLEKKSIVLDEATNTRVWIDGSLAFRPSIDLKLAFGPTYAHAIARGALDAKLNVTASANVSKTYSKSVLLWESPAFSMPLGWIGPVPIKFQAKLAVRAVFTLDASGKISATTGFTFHADGGYGFRYQDGSLSAVKEWFSNAEVTPLKVTSAYNLDMTAALRAEIDGGINGDVWLASATGGLRLAAEAYATAHVDASTWSAKVGVRADARAYLQVVAFWWSREWESDPIVITDVVLKSWTPTSSKPTVTAACTSGSPATCGPSLGAACAACANGDPCTVNADCSSNWCSNGYCVAAPFSTGAGEACTYDWGCKIGLSCVAEVQSNKTIARVCRPLTCSNDIKDGDEVDRNCGGSCRRCLAGFTCKTNNDCASNVCRAGSCAPR